MAVLALDACLPAPFVVKLCAKCQGTQMLLPVQETGPLTQAAWRGVGGGDNWEDFWWAVEFPSLEVCGKERRGNGDEVGEGVEARDSPVPQLLG